MADDDSDLPLAVALTGAVLLFALVFGMSATVDIHCLNAQLHNTKAIATGLCLQFLVMPFLGFFVVRTLDLDYATGLILLVVTSSPGGSYSNWFCSLFNADLALSVAMTAISTILSVVMLPLNLLVYTRLAYQNDIRDLVEWDAVAFALSIVLIAIISGLTASAKYGNADFHLFAYRLGNFAGVCLVLFSAIVSNSNGSRLWSHSPKFYFGVALPCILGVLVATAVTTYMQLQRPERVTVAVECCIQNCGIAVSVALTMFEGEYLSRAAAVPFYYGIVECCVIAVYCLSVWKAGWTKAPREVGLWSMISTSYEIQPTEHESERDGFYYTDHGEETGQTEINHIPVKLPKKDTRNAVIQQASI